MKKLLLIVITLVATSVQADQVNLCEGQAKYGAIKAYHSEVGVVQGSEGIEYIAELRTSTALGASYHIDIYDGNEDGDVWKIQYFVTVKKTNSGKCLVSSVKKLETTELDFN